VTWYENAFRSVYDFLAEHSAVLEAVGALVGIIAFAGGLIARYSLVFIITFGALAFVCSFALLVGTSIRRDTRMPVRRRVLAAMGTLLLLGAAVLVALWGVPKLRYPLARPAIEDEILIVVAEFEDRSVQRDLQVQRLIIARTLSDLAETELENVRLEEAPVVSAIEEVKQMGEKYHAAIVIWGWYDDVGFWPNFTITRPEKSPHIEVDLQGPEVIHAVPGTRVTVHFSGEVTGGEYLVLRDLNLPGKPILPDAFGLFIVEKMPSQMSYLSLFTIAQIYYWDQQYDQALNVLDIAIQRAQEGEIHDGLAFAWFSKAYIYQEVLGSDQEALEAYTKAIDFDPSFVEAYSNRGLIYFDYVVYAIDGLPLAGRRV